MGFLAMASVAENLAVGDLVSTTVPDGNNVVTLEVLCGATVSTFAASETEKLPLLAGGKLGLAPWSTVYRVAFGA